MKTTEEMKRLRRQEAYLNFLKRDKKRAEQLLLETTSIKDMPKRQSTHDLECP